jgi:HD-GYP domain-containing protein (c-di-GMP phosphodiesterase class II)
VLALFSVIAASLIAVLDISNFAAFTSPIIIGLSLTVWGAVLGLTALLVGTLSDEHAAKLVELHEAHVGVIEVLSRYLQSGDPKLRARSHRVAALSQRVAAQMKLSTKEIDDIRVAALLHDMENIEITAKVIRKAMGDLEGEHKGPQQQQHTFHGTDLVHSLGSVLTGAFPLLLNQSDSLTLAEPAQGSNDVPFGARIIRTVRAYDSLMESEWGRAGATPDQIIAELRRDTTADYHPAVLHALERTVSKADASASAPPPAPAQIELPDELLAHHSASH